VNNPLDDAFEQIHEQVDSVVYRELRQIRWEENVVKKILKFYKLEAWEKKLRQECHDRTGERRLQFCWFFEEFQTFPVWLYMEKISFAWDIRFSELVGKGLKHNIYEKWEEALDAAPDERERGAGFVFEMLQTGGRSRTWIVHDQWQPAVRITYQYVIQNPAVANPRTYVLDDFYSFLENLRWDPPREQYT